MKVYNKNGQFITRHERAIIKARKRDILQGVIIAVVFGVIITCIELFIK